MDKITDSLQLNNLKLELQTLLEQNRMKSTIKQEVQENVLLPILKDLEMLSSSGHINNERQLIEHLKSKVVELQDYKLKDFQNPHLEVLSKNLARCVVACGCENQQSIAPKAISERGIGKVVKQWQDADFSFELPTVDIDEELRTLLSNQPDGQKKIDSIRSECLADYRESLKALDESIADISLKQPHVEAILKDVNSRYFTVIEKYAEILLAERNPQRTSEFDKAEIDLKVNELLVNIFSSEEKNKLLKNSKKNIADSSIVRGVKNEAGGVGMNPLSIRGAFKEGNLRERFYLLYKASRFLGELSLKPSYMEQINNKLMKDNAEWQIGNDILKMANEVKDRNIYVYGAYAQKTSDDSLRLPLTNSKKEKIKKENIPIRDDSKRRESLSHREFLHVTDYKFKPSENASEALIASYERTINRVIPWEPGSFWYAPDVENKSNYAISAKVSAVPLLAGISGSTDQIMTTCIFLGVDDIKNLTIMRLGLLGWMIDAKDHSSHEIMTASKAFGLEYVHKPTWYRNIDPVDPDFCEKLQSAQSKRNFSLPELYLSKEYAKQKAKDLGFL